MSRGLGKLQQQILAHMSREDMTEVSLRDKKFTNDADGQATRIHRQRFAAQEIAACLDGMPPDAIGTATRMAFGLDASRSMSESVRRALRALQKRDFVTAWTIPRATIIAPGGLALRAGGPKILVWTLTLAGQAAGDFFAKKEAAEKLSVASDATLTSV